MVKDTYSELGLEGKDLEEDFGFYGNEADNEEVKDIKGITDSVTDFTYTSISYPCLIFKDGFSCPKHKMKVISNMVKVSKSDKDTSLYFVNNSELFKLGMLEGRQVDPLLELVGVENMFGYYLDGTRLEGDRLYALCTF